MTHIYAIGNQKGGVGKTTTAVSLGAYLAHRQKQVLLVDMDPQANATSSLGFDKYTVYPSVYNVLIDGSEKAGAFSLSDCIRHTSIQGLDLVPSAPELAGAEVELVPASERENRLRQAISTVLMQYDIILIDCPPSLGLLTVNAVTAADGIIIPVQCEYLPLEGLGALIRTIDLVRERLNPRLEITGLLMTMYDPRTNLAQQVVDEVRRHFPDKVFRTIIPRNVRLSEAPSFGQTILTYDPQSRGALAYQMLADELIQREQALLGSRE
ncbi:MAG: ParA family protein [Chloroflexi bacterium]|nr:ParA family protein [Chloroflexota bacterium]